MQELKKGKMAAKSVSVWHHFYDPTALFPLVHLHANGPAKRGIFLLRVWAKYVDYWPLRLGALCY